MHQCELQGTVYICEGAFCLIRYISTHFSVRTYSTQQHIFYF